MENINGPTLFCTNCGAKIGNVNFCPYCGNKTNGYKMIQNNQTGKETNYANLNNNGESMHIPNNSNPNPSADINNNSNILFFRYNKNKFLSIKNKVRNAGEYLGKIGKVKGKTFLIFWIIILLVIEVPLIALEFEPIRNHLGIKVANMDDSPAGLTAGLIIFAIIIIVVIIFGLRRYKNQKIRL